MDKFVKDNLQQSNTIKINNFGKRYQTYAQVLTNQELREEDENNKKKKDELAYEHNKQITSDTKTEGNEMLIKIIVMTIQQLAKSIEVVQDVLIIVCMAKDEDKKKIKMEQCIQKIKSNKESAAMIYKV